MYALADGTGPLWSCSGPWAALCCGAGCPGGAEPPYGTVAFEEEAVINSQRESISVLEAGGGLARCGPSASELLGRLLETHVSGLRGDEFIFGGEDWSVAFPAGSPCDFDGP